MNMTIARPPLATRPPADLAGAYGELRSGLLAFLRKYTGEAQAAEDLLHDVMLKALAHSDPSRMPKNLTGWLYAVARNAAMDYHRAKRPSEPLPEDLAEPMQDEDDAALIDLANCLRPMTERLPPHYRETVLATELERRPLKLVAADQGLSLSAVKSRASRGRRMLQQELVKCCRVMLSNDGKVVDYDQAAAAKCLPESDACTAKADKGCKN